MDVWTSQVVYSILESTDLEGPTAPPRKLLEVSDGSVLTWFFTYSSGDTNLKSLWLFAMSATGLQYRGLGQMLFLSSPGDTYSMLD